MFRMNRNNKPEPVAGEQTAPATANTVPPATPDARVVAAPVSAPAHSSAPTPSTPPRAPQQTNSPALNTPTAPRAITETDALARDLKDGLIGGFVGVHSVLAGEANFKGMLRVDGRVSGRINSQDGTLIVSAGGQVEADIEVAVAKINGTVKGDIKARGRIELGRTARVTGDLQTPALIIEQGALYEGNCRMTAAQPAAQTQPRAAVPGSKESKSVVAPTAPAVAPRDLAGAQVERERAAV